MAAGSTPFQQPSTSVSQTPSTPGPMVSSQGSDAQDPKLRMLQQVLAAVRRGQELNLPLDPDNPDPQLYDALAGLYPDQIRDALKELERIGDIYSPRPGLWRLTHADGE